MNNPFAMLAQMMQARQNPQMIINNMIRNNPQARMLINQVQDSGLSPKEYFRQFAHQNNIDINQLSNMMSQFGIRLK